MLIVSLQVFATWLHVPYVFTVPFFFAWWLLHLHTLWGFPAERIRHVLAQQAEDSALLVFLSRAAISVAFIAVSALSFAIFNYARMSIGPSVSLFDLSPPQQSDVQDESSSTDANCAVPSADGILSDNDIRSNAQTSDLAESPIPAIVPISAFADRHLPMFWVLGSVDDIVEGVSARPVDEEALLNDPSFCEARNVYAVGISSGDGAPDRNESLSRSRAIYLGELASARAQKCSGVSAPKILLVSLGFPRNGEADAWARRVLLFSVGSDEGDVEISRPLNDMRDLVSEVIDMSVDNYSVFETCEKTDENSSCEWRSVP